MVNCQDYGSCICILLSEKPGFKGNAMIKNNASQMLNKYIHVKKTMQFLCKFDQNRMINKNVVHNLLAKIFMTVCVTSHHHY